MFIFAVMAAAGFNFEFLRTVWLDVYVSEHRLNLATLPLYWLLWNLLPLTIFGVSRLLHKQGK